MYIRDLIARIRGARLYALIALRLLRILALVATDPFAWIAVRGRIIRRLLMFTVICFAFLAWVIEPIAHLHDRMQLVQDISLTWLGFAALLSLLRWIFHARRRVVIETFTEYGGTPFRRSDVDDAVIAVERRKRTTGTATLLAIELADLRELYLDTDDRRSTRGDRGLAISQTPATIQASDVDDLFTATSAGDATLTVGPLTVPLGVLLALFSRLVRGPRIIGSVHRSSSSLVVTAQLVGAASSSGWRVECPSTTDGRDMTILVEDLGCRIFTDVMLGRPCNFSAAVHFTAGLRAYRECLRTPAERNHGLRDAERAFRRATAADESFEHAYHNLGIVYADMGRLDSADQAFAAAIVRDSTAWASYYALAHIRMQLAMSAQDSKDVQLASRYFRESASLANQASLLEPPHPSAAMSHNLAGLVERELAGLASDRAEREVHLRRFVSHALWAARFAAFDFAFIRVLTPRSATQSESLVGLCFRNLGVAWDRYANHLRIVLSDDEAASRSWRERWIQRCQARLYRWRARGCLAIGVRRRPNDAQARYARGKAYEYTWRDDRSRGRFHRRALRAYRQAVAIDPMALQYASRLAYALSEAKNVEEGEVVSAAAGIMESPTSARASDIDRVAKALSNLGRREEAELVQQIGKLREVSLPATFRQSDILARLETCDVPWVEAMLRLALSRTRAAAGRTKIAARDFQDAIETLKPSHASEIALLGLYAELAVMQAELGDLTGAFHLCEMAIDLAPLNPSVRETQGDIFASQGDWEHARIAWEEALLCTAQADSHWRRSRYFQDSASARDLRVEPEPEYAQIHFKLGCCYLEIADGMHGGTPRSDAMARALESLERALSLYDHSDKHDPQVHEQRLQVHFWLGRANTAICNYEAAFPHLEIAGALESGQLASTLYLGEAHLLGKRYESAERLLRKILETSVAESEATLARTSQQRSIDDLSMTCREARAKASLLLAVSLLERNALSTDLDELLAEARSLNSGATAAGVRSVLNSSEGRVWASRLAYATGLQHAARDENTKAIAAFRTSLSLEANPEAYLALARLHEKEVGDATSSRDLRRKVGEGLFNVEQARRLDHAGHYATTATRLEGQLSSLLDPPRRARSGEPDGRDD